MQPLRAWSFARVLLASAAWIALTIALAVSWVFMQAHAEFADAGSGGIGAVSFGISVPVLLVPVAPPILLMATWIFLRSRRR